MLTNVQDDRAGGTRAHGLAAVYTGHSSWRGGKQGGGNGSSQRTAYHTTVRLSDDLTA